MPKPKNVEPKLVNIEINGIPLQVPEGELLIEAAKRIGADIPIFCYHQYMKPVGMCRMCLVEVGTKQPDGSIRKMPKPQASCTLPCTEGLVAWTESEQIIKDRRAILEFLLINHPLDCPICDRGGECPLQNNTQFYGPPVSRYIEIKRHLPKAFPLSRYVALDLERCIHCGRCVRFTEEISGDAQLAFLFRGAHMQPHTFQLTEFTSRFSGNVIEICPVGALTSRTYRFRARPWDIVTQKSVCSLCSNGCNLYLDSRAGQIVRINARENPAVNETWTCDKGKFEQVAMLAANRLTQPLRRRGSDWEPISWADAYDMLLGRISEARKTGDGHAIAGIAGQRMSNESLYLFQKLFRAAFQTNNLDHRMTRYQGNLVRDVASSLGYPTTCNEYGDLACASLVFVFGSDLIEEQPMVYLRLRKAWRYDGVKVIVAYPIETAVDTFAELSLHYPVGGELELVRALLHDQPDARWGQEMRVMAERLTQSPDVIILAGEKVWNHPESEALIRALVELTKRLPNGSLNLMLPEANSQGALDMGVLPDLLPGYLCVEDTAARARFEAAYGVPLPAQPGLNTDAILNACLQGTVRVLYLAGADPLTQHYDPSFAARALRACEFLVVQDAWMTETAHYADLLLPACTFAEGEGTFTNWERRVQRFWKALEPPGDAKPDWLIFAELWLRTMRQTPPFNPREIMCEIGDLVPAYADCTYEQLGDQGKRWT
jgi:NADH-quinone oxidoreductase subunit G